MKAASLIACGVAIISMIVGAHLTNIGQEMAVRVGGLSGEDLHRIPSSSVLAEARKATASTDQKKAMGAFHMILNAQLMLLLLVSFATAAPLVTSWRKSSNHQSVQHNAGSRPSAPASPASETLSESAPRG
jgi:hypothetical protein